MTWIISNSLVTAEVDDGSSVLSFDIIVASLSPARLRLERHDHRGESFGLRSYQVWKISSFEPCA
jgi:hypothetical protein